MSSMSSPQPPPSSCSSMRSSSQRRAMSRRMRSWSRWAVAQAGAPGTSGPAATSGPHHEASICAGVSSAARSSVSHWLGLMPASMTPSNTSNSMSSGKSAAANPRSTKPWRMECLSVSMATASGSDGFSTNCGLMACSVVPTSLVAAKTSGEGSQASRGSVPSLRSTRACSTVGPVRAAGMPRSSRTAIMGFRLAGDSPSPVAAWSAQSGFRKPRPPSSGQARLRQWPGSKRWSRARWKLSSSSSSQAQAGWLALAACSAARASGMRCP